jgi:kumamolisin
LKLRNHARRRIAAAAAAAAVIPAAALIASNSASASTPPASSPGGEVSVAQGTNPGTLKGAVAFGTTPADTPEAVSFILRGRNLSGLALAVEAGHSPGLSTAQFAARYGQSPAVINRLESYLKGFGISITTTYADGLDVSTTGTAGQYDSALSVQQQQYHVSAVKGRGGQPGIPAQTIHGTKQSPRMPTIFGRDVLAVLGLSNYAPFTDHLTHTPGQVKSPTSAKPTADYTGNLTPSDFEKQYNLSPLYKKGITGSGETLGIVTLAGFDPTTAETFWSTLGINTAANRITVNNVDGGPGAPNEKAGSGESDIDVEQSGAIAPDANIIVYQAPNTDPGFADAVFSAASDNIADTVSTSWGESETVVDTSVAAGVETPAYEAAFDEGFLEMAAQNQSMFASAGDQGAYDAINDAQTTNLTVDTPGDSPFVTSAGGTTLGGTIADTLTGANGPVTLNVQIPAERAWGWDWLWPQYAAFGATSEGTFALSQIAGGGGGFSSVEQTPLYQEGVPGTHSYKAVEYLTPSNPVTTNGLTLPTSWTFNGSPSVTSGWATGRAEPDVSADADPFTGYLLYDPLGTTPWQGGWGGTSFVAPQLNGSTALIDQYVGHRVGLWNPSIYRFATSGHSPFTSLGTTGTSNDNLYYTGEGTTYNVGTGLGTPNLAELASDFAR